jgi:hypothetical protein
MIRPALEADIAAIVRLNADVLALHTENAPWAYHCPKTDAEPVAWFSAILKEPATRFWVEVDEGDVVRGYLFAKEIISEATWMRPAQHYLMLNTLSLVLTTGDAGSATDCLRNSLRRQSVWELNALAFSLGALIAERSSFFNDMVLRQCFNGWRNPWASHLTLILFRTIYVV